jgi:hypothetical protein
LTRDDDWDDNGDECKDPDFAPHEPSIFNVNGGQGERCQRIQVPVREEEPSTEENPDKMSVSQVSGPRPGGDSNDRENGSVNLWNLESTRSRCGLVAHIGDRNREIKPFPVREGVPTTMVPVLFTPVFPPGCGVESRSLVENESCRTETDEGENGEKAENPVDEDIHTAKRLHVVTKLGKESVGVRRKVWFRWLLLDGILGEACPYLFDGFPSRNVVKRQ